MTGSGSGGTPLAALAIRGFYLPVVLALLLSGCIFHLDDPIAASGGAPGTGGTLADGGAAGSASGGGGASSGGGASAGGGAGAGATGGAANCPTGAKRCSTDCVPIDDPAFGCSSTGCSECPQLATANWTCSSGKCVFESCHDGFGDCDGSDDNGCEIKFDDLPQSSGPLTSVDAFRASMRIEIDGLATDPDWLATTARRRRIGDVCQTCTTQSPIPKVVDPKLPPVKDLEAWFRTAWDESSLYAIFEVRDDELVPAENPISMEIAQFAGASAVEDAVELLISSDRSQGGFGMDDMQLFAGVDGALGRANQKAPPAPNISFVKKGHGCYTIELDLRFAYINPKFTPALGQVIGFTAAVNDWDYLPQVDGGRIPERQAHIFSADPGDQYWNNAQSFAALTLAGPP